MANCERFPERPTIVSKMKANRSMLEHSHSNGTSIQDVIKMQSRSIQDAFMKQSSVDNQGCQESIRTGSNFGYSSLDLNSIKSIQAATPGPLAECRSDTHLDTLSLGGVASCTLRSYGVLGLAPRHFTCTSTGRNTCRYAGLIRPSISRGIALFVGQPAMLTGLPPCTVS